MNTKLILFAGLFALLNAQAILIADPNYPVVDSSFGTANKTIIGISNINNNGGPAVVADGVTGKVSPGKGAVIVQGLGSNIIGGASVFGKGGDGVAYYEKGHAPISDEYVLAKGNVVYQNGQGTINGAPGGDGNGQGVYKGVYKPSSADFLARQAAINARYGAVPRPPVALAVVPAKATSVTTLRAKSITTSKVTTLIPLSKGK